MPRCPCASWKGKPVDTQLDAGPWHGSRSHLGKALVDVVSDPLRKNLTLMCACQTQAISTSATLRTSNATGRSASGNSGSHLQHHLATATSDDNHLGFRSSTLRRLCGRQRSSTPLAQPSIHLFEQPSKAASTSAYPSPTPSNHRQTTQVPCLRSLAIRARPLLTVSATSLVFVCSGPLPHNPKHVVLRCQPVVSFPAVLPMLVLLFTPSALLRRGGFGILLNLRRRLVGDDFSSGEHFCRWFSLDEVFWGLCAGRRPKCDAGWFKIE